jgi:hypothetical protein
VASLVTGVEASLAFAITPGKMFDFVNKMLMSKVV